MTQIYFLQEAGEIQHMLLIAWGGEPLIQLQWKECPKVEEEVTCSDLGARASP